jgi:Ser/Thr protein kinase RdoA (MazF antagonist)
MLSERILAMYGLADTQLLAIEKGYRNESHAAMLPNGKQINIIIYKREPGILATLKRANLVGNYLAEQGFLARRTYDPRIMRLGAGDSAQYAALYEYLPGSTIPWDGYTMKHLKQVGAQLSAMHLLLGSTPFKLDNRVADEYQAIVGRMRYYFARLGVQNALCVKLGLKVSVPAHFSRLLAGCAKLPNQQVLHMDFVRGNLLFDDAANVTGVLDFEKTAWGHSLFDIARTLAFLLVDCKYKTSTQIHEYFLTSGYNKHGAGSFKVTAKNARLLERLIDLFLFYDFYKFLRHNPYESLPQNEHFVRTQALLLQRQLLAHIAKKPHTIA